MRKRVSLFSVFLFMALPLMAGQAKKIDLQDYAAGRIRFVQGEGATCTFNNKTFAPLMDYLVLLGATFETNGSRLELATLNRNLYWFDNGTDFYFESIDPRGDTTRLFLGKGSFVVKTKLPFTMISGAGSVYFPGNGRYMVMKNAFGKDKVFVTTLEGEKPVIVKKSTIFSRIKLKKQEDSGLTAWVTDREDNWRRTLTRANVFSNVDKMPPYVAFTGTDGKRHWKKVTDVKPIYRMNGMLSGNWLLFNPRLLRATGLWTPYAIYMDDFQISLFFATRQWNSVRWAWSVPSGWYAEYYWDPLAGFGADNRFDFLMVDNVLADYWIWNDYRRGWLGDWFYDQGRMSRGRSDGYVYGSYDLSDNRSMPVEHYPGLADTGRGRIGFRGDMTDSRIVRSHRWITSNVTSRIRTRVDRTIRTERQARDLNVSHSRLVRARQIVDRRRTRGTRIGNRSMGSSYRGATRTFTSTSTVPSISTSSGNLGSGSFSGRVRTVSPGH
ncbi:MAG: hypothetical protein CO090_06645 [Acidobacteria bacterium CG_4_9_14_3_um_filter_49_7]|nr:MAG: hypothetical protein CO090_06645 [Acidobacteria bacterium CG_4_9_14_3_um_filter_49_7]